MKYVLKRYIRIQLAKLYWKLIKASLRIKPKAKPETPAPASNSSGEYIVAPLQL